MAYLIHFWVLLSAFFGNQSAQKPNCSIAYKGLTVCFPITVGDAVARYQLDFISPGHYYKVLPDSTNFVLYYSYGLGELDNESQSAPVLYPKIVNAYMFKMNSKPRLFTEECRQIESLLGVKMKITEETALGVQFMNAENFARLPDKGKFPMAEALTKDSIQVIVRVGPRLSVKQKQGVEVFFSKGRPAKELRYLTHGYQLSQE